MRFSKEFDSTKSREVFKGSLGLLLVWAASLVVWILVSWISAGLISRWLGQIVASPPSRINPVPSNGGGIATATSHREVVSLAMAFGASRGDESGWLLSDVRLLGLIDAGEDSVAVLKFKNGPIQRLRLGQISLEGWTLLSVQAGRVTIKRQAQEMTISATLTQALNTRQ